MNPRQTGAKPPPTFELEDESAKGFSDDAQHATTNGAVLIEWHEFEG